MQVYLWGFFTAGRGTWGRAAPWCSTRQPWPSGMTEKQPVAWWPSWPSLSNAPTAKGNCFSPSLSSKCLIKLSLHSIHCENKVTMEGIGSFHLILQAVMLLLSSVSFLLAFLSTALILTSQLIDNCANTNSTSPCGLEWKSAFWNSKGVLFVWFFFNSKNTRDHEMLTLDQLLRGTKHLQLLLQRCLWGNWHKSNNSVWQGLQFSFYLRRLKLSVETCTEILGQHCC